MFLDTANISDITKAFSFANLKGVTTNPSILLKEGKQRSRIIREILENSEGLIFVQAVGDSYSEIYDDCKEILALDPSRVGLKIPANIDGLKTMKKLKQESRDVSILATAIFSVDQGILSALAGCDYIAPYINRMENNNINPYEVVRKTRKIYDDRHFATQILAASFKNTTQVINILEAGAHTTTVSYDILESMASKDLAAKSIEKFNQDWRELERRMER